MEKQLSIRGFIEKSIHSSKTYLSAHQQCVFCHQGSNQRLCEHCRAYLIQSQYACQSCALPLEHFATQCGECLKTPPVYDEIFAPLLYQFPLRELIHRFKNQGELRIGKALSDIFCDYLSTNYQQSHQQLPQWVAPVPLHWRRQWQRGFNQSLVLGETMVKSNGLRWFLHTKRSRNHQAQKTLSRQKRKNNLLNSFNVTKTLKGESIAIIDDVMTTGATVNAYAKALKQAGAGKVSVWALARTPLR
jgi:ComF family protein